MKPPVRLTVLWLAISSVGLAGCLSLLGDFGVDGGVEDEAGAFDATFDGDAGPDVAADEGLDADGGADADGASDAEAAVPCTSSSCAPGQTCTDAGCACGPSCTTGCCTDAGACVSLSPGTCGSPGMACGACGPGQACDPTGTCVCNEASCTAGCCNAAGACVPYANQSPMSCGAAGAVCAECSTGQACDPTAGTCTCTTASCVDGCCAADGGCVPLPASSSVPGTVCKASDGCTGTYVCAAGSTSTVTCNAPTALNGCGGCTTLSPPLGMMCSTACSKGTYVCNKGADAGGDGGKDSVVCNATPLDPCKGCPIDGGTSTACLVPPLCELSPGTCGRGGVCSYTQATDGTSCNDKGVCGLYEACRTGMCVPKLGACSDGMTCNPAADGCP